MILKRVIKKMKYQEGFTLVEVIVVAVIVAVLAAVAIPIYLNYIKESRRNQANNIAGSVASFCGACEASSGVCVAAAGTCTGNTATVEIPVGYAVTDAPAGKVTAQYGTDAATKSEVYTYK